MKSEPESKTKGVNKSKEDQLFKKKSDIYKERIGSSLQSIYDEWDLLELYENLQPNQSPKTRPLDSSGDSTPMRIKKVSEVKIIEGYLPKEADLRISPRGVHQEEEVKTDVPVQKKKKGSLFGKGWKALKGGAKKLQSTFKFV